MVRGGPPAGPGGGGKICSGTWKRSPERPVGVISLWSIWPLHYNVSYTRACETSTGCLRSICLVHPGVRDKLWVSEIDLSQPRHKTAFWWRHNEPVTSQLTNPIKWPNYPLQLIGIYVHINIHNKESLTQRYQRATNVQLCLIFLYISIWFEC